MPIDFPTIVYLVITGLVMVELPAVGFKTNKIYSLFVSLRLLTCFTGIVFIGFSVGRPPMFGPFESTVYILFIMGILSLVFQKNWGYQRRFALFSSLGVLIILLLQWSKPMALNGDYFMYTNLWVTLFFNFRLLAAAFLAHGACQYLGTLFGEKKEVVLSSGGRNTLLTGACLYLAGEWAGSLWCLNWFGDSWQWSRGFFKASILFLLIMVACHLPPGITRNKVIRGVSGTLPGIFILWMIFYH